MSATRPASFARLRLDAPGRSISLGAARLPAGIYTVRIQSRVVAAGSYQAAPPRLIISFTGAAPVSGRQPLRIESARQ
jgi:hypothetical protein